MWFESFNTFYLRVMHNEIDKDRSVPVSQARICKVIWKSLFSVSEAYGNWQVRHWQNDEANPNEWM